MDKEFGYSFNIQTKKEIDNIKNDINSLNNQTNTIKDEKADKTVVDNIQQQINNLDSQVKATNNEITQAKGSNALLKDRFDSNELKLSQIENKNTEQDSKLSSIEYTNKRQDILLDGLLNENDDKRLAIGGEGNHLKLENSKEGIVEVDSIIGGTLVNLSGVYYNNSNISTGDIATINSKDTVYNSPTYRIKEILPTQTIGYGKTYTIIYNCLELTNVSEVNSFIKYTDNTQVFSTFSASSLGLYKGVFTTENKEVASLGIYLDELVEGTAKISSVIILEGDYATPRGYFEGMKSTFEDCLVTQEMIDAGTEKAENLGKYKGELKVVGKNLLDIQNIKIIEQYNTIFEPHGNGIRLKYNDAGPTSTSAYTYIRSDYYKINPNVKRFIISFKATSNKNQTPRILVKLLRFKDKSGEIKSQSCNGNAIHINVVEGAKYLQFIIYSCTGNEGIVKDDFIDYFDVQLEGANDIDAVATQYEPYKESKQTLYLDEPLYTNNELCIHNGKLGYWKRTERVVPQVTYNTSHEGFMIFEMVLNDMRDNLNPDIVYLMSDKLECKSYSDRLHNQRELQVYNTPTSKKIYIRSTKSTIELNKYLEDVVLLYPCNPTFIPILDNTPQWILDCFNECTLSIDSNIPAISMRASYSSNVVSVVALEKIQQQQDAVYLDNAYRLTVLEIANGGVV